VVGEARVVLEAVASSVMVMTRLGCLLRVASVMGRVGVGGKVRAEVAVGAETAEETAWAVVETVVAGEMARVVVEMGVAKEVMRTAPGEMGMAAGAMGR